MQTQKTQQFTNPQETAHRLPIDFPKTSQILPKYCSKSAQGLLKDCQKEVGAAQKIHSTIEFKVKGQRILLKRMLIVAK